MGRITHLLLISYNTDVKSEGIANLTACAHYGRTLQLSQCSTLGLDLLLSEAEKKHYATVCLYEHSQLSDGPPLDVKSVDNCQQVTSLEV